MSSRRFLKGLKLMSFKNIRKNYIIYIFSFTFLFLYCWMCLRINMLNQFILQETQILTAISAEHYNAFKVISSSLPPTSLALCAIKQYKNISSSLSFSLSRMKHITIHEKVFLTQNLPIPGMKR
jgi:hypothetical protein